MVLAELEKPAPDLANVKFFVNLMKTQAAIADK